MRKFDTTPKPAFLLAMRNQRWTVQGALSELVDNGFGPGRGNARRVDIVHDTTNRVITVLDDGQGMESRESPPEDLPGTGGRGDEDHEPKASARDPGDDTPKESPAVCRVKIYRQSDDQMKGVLCRAVIMSDAHNQEFGVEVNQDHPSMQEAMKQRPINRMALLAWIVAEIGKELPFHPELLRRVVPKRMLDNILGENDREQGRIVTRLLIDRACKPKKAAA